MSLKKWTLLLAAQCLLLTPIIDARAQDKPSAETIQTAMRSVVQIQSGGCSGHQSVGTGFVWGESRYIVTALHVVAGCNEISIFFERPSPLPPKSASILKVVRHLDLALLELGAGGDVEPLVASGGQATSDLEYRAIGFSEQQPSMGDVEAIVSNGQARLTAFLGQNELSGLSNAGIDVDRPIIRFQTGLNPGMSGGPIIDPEGEVIAVAAGGLKNLPVPPSFGWPVADLEALLASTESLAELTSFGASTLTSATSPEEAGETVSCGNVSFTLVGSYSFADSWQQADDPVRVQNVAQASLQPLSEIEGLIFNLWRDPESGATVFVPEDADLEWDGDGCSASNAFGVKQIVWGQKTQNLYERQAVSVQFEQTFAGPFGTMLWPDNLLTSPGPIFANRTDGAVFTRKGVVAGYPSYPPTPPTVTAHLFETLMARNETFVGVQVANSSYAELANAQSQCSYQQFPPACQRADQLLKAWTPFVLATQLSTFPRY